MAAVVCNGARERPPGFDGDEPVHVVGCGRLLEVDESGPWDTKTDSEGVTVSLHRDVVCPWCGVSTYVEEADLERP